MKSFIVAIVGAALIGATTQGPLDRIAAGESASAVLGDWCSAHHLPPLHADRLSQRKAPEGGARSALKAAGDATIAYRRVRLACGSRTLSVADNWYLPTRLTPDMNRQLGATDAPFGLVVRPLAFQRHTLAAGPDGHGRFVVRAVLVDQAGAPFSYVVERYAALPQ